MTKRTHPSTLVPVLVLVSGCMAPRAQTRVARPSVAPTAPAHVARAGTLVTTIGDRELGRETFSDDGHVLTSQLHFQGSGDATIRLDRDHRRVTLEQGGARIERDIPPGALALENFHWAAYVVAAEQVAAAATPTPVQVLLPSRAVVVPGTIQVTARPDGGRHVVVVIDALAVEADVSPAGIVVAAGVPSQGVVARAPEPSAAAPSTTGDIAFAVERAGLTLRGAIRRPEGPGPFPTVVLIAGSGPTDRDGNNPLGVSAASYRLLADALAARGVASFRYDKRGVGGSDRPRDLDALTFDDFVRDAGAVVAFARQDPAVSTLYVCGHSEGGLIALALAPDVPLDGLVLVATSGRPAATLLREQLAARAAATTLQEYDRLVAGERAGRFVAPHDPALAPIFARSLFHFRRGWLFTDPIALQKRLTVPTLVLQGDHDLQVTVGDARSLAAARPGVRLTILAGVSHVLKVDPSTSLPQASYRDPGLPIAPALVDAIVAQVRP